MAPQVPHGRYTSTIELESDFSDGGSEYWPQDSSYIFKPNDNFYHKSLASQWMESIGQSHKGTYALQSLCSEAHPHIIPSSSKDVYQQVHCFLSFLYSPCNFSVLSYLLFNLTHLLTQIGKTHAQRRPAAYSCSISTPPCREPIWMASCFCCMN